jgi:hypothetical protein
LDGWKKLHDHDVPDGWMTRRIGWMDDETNWMDEKSFTTALHDHDVLYI